MGTQEVQSCIEFFLYSTQIGQLSESLDIQQAASLALNSKH